MVSLRVKPFFLILFVYCSSGFIGFAAPLPDSGWIVIGSFQNGWTQDWTERVLADRANTFRVETEGSISSLRFESNKSASGFWRKWREEPIRSRSISWQWKVQSSLSGNDAERTKKGDDFAARVFVVFEPNFFDWKTKSICYVWAGNEAVGSIFENPYSKSVGQVVLESGNSKAGQWIQEERDFVADYQRYFGKYPTRISAFAVMVDTDNTGGQAETWFRDLKITADKIIQ
jgi:Protein of unknown function (DUF3047)